MSKKILEVIFSTFLQGILIIIFFEVGKALYQFFIDIKSNIGRGIFWQYYIFIFIGLSFFANIFLVYRRTNSKIYKRLSIWFIVFFIMIVYSFDSFSSIPLSTVFINLCALFTILSYEFSYFKLITSSINKQEL